MWLLTALLTSLALACSSPVPTSAPTPTATLAPSFTPGVTASAELTAAPALFDFGDAPDPSYPTLLASNGARTKVIDQFWLGNLRAPSVTNETDAKVVDRDELDDGLEAYIPFGGGATLSFRAVRSPTAEQHLPDFIVYFNLLVDFDRDGRWQDGDWLVRNREVDLTSESEVLLDVSAPAPIDDTWIRAALTDVPVADSAADWDGTGEFATGEIEDYYLPTSPPSSPPPTPTYSPTPTPTYTPTPTPSEQPTLTYTLAPTVAPSPTFVYTGDFVVECEPFPAHVIHGESVTIALKIVSGAHTPPERFGVYPSDKGTVSADPPPGDDGWSRWVDGASVTFTSTHIDPPPRTESTFVSLTLQSLSTTRIISCWIGITHTAPSPSPTQIQTPTIRVDPEVVTLSLVGQVKATVSGEGFTPGGRVDLRFKPPNHPAITGTAEVGSDGRFSLDLNLQPGMPKGTWQVTATDRATGGRVEATFQVR